MAQPTAGTLPKKISLPAPGSLPRNTPVKSLGFTPAQLSKLTPAASKLTKGDLLALQKWGAAGGKGPAPGHLTVADLSSLQRAFPNPTASIQALKAKSQGTTYCCCCSPCCTCTAAAEISPVRHA
jgi:hypothetical protein